MDVNGLRLPDFIIAGAPRAATTWLYTLADRHPGIAMAKPVRPEPKYFLIDDLYQRGVEHYSRTWFSGLPHDRRLGEKSTNYLESPHAAARMKADIPHVRLVFLLRNPVDRAYSNYLWTCKNGLETESFRRALELEAARELDLPERLRFARPYSYFSRGLYAEHLARFFALFPREQILVLRSEDVETRPQGVASAFHRFVGVAERPDDADALGRINSAVEAQTEDLDPGLREHLAQRYLRPNRDLADLLGTDFAMWP